MSITITAGTVRWLIIPLVILFFFGLTGVLPDNPFRPVRATVALFSLIGILAWITFMIARAWML